MSETNKVIKAEFFLQYAAEKNHNKKEKTESIKPFSLDVNIEIPFSGITAIFGHSGSGKTTLLRAIAGLDVVKKGRLIVDDHVWQDSANSVWVDPHQRSVGYVFQEASLLPHLTARKNLMYAVKRAEKESSQIDMNYVVTLLGLESILDRKPNQLSGGERQRVAIAQALLIQPKLLLWDEPFGALDEITRDHLIPYIEKLKTELNIPVIYVSHSPDEIARLADNLVVLDEGKVVASGELKDTLARIDLPIKLGDETGVVIDVKIEAKDLQWNLMAASFSGGNIWIKDQGEKIGETARLRILARDVSITLTQHADSSIVNVFPVVVEEIVTDDHEGTALIKLNAKQTPILSKITLRSLKHLNIKVGAVVWAQVKSVALVF